MGLDMKKMREKYAALKNRGQGGKSNFWRPQEGKQTIRIVPTADGDPFKDYWFHYNLGKEPGFLSPKKNFGEEDPLNDFIRELYKGGSEDEIKMAKELGARQRFFAPVIVRGEEDAGVRVWGFGRTVYEEILGLILNPDYGDITCIEAGHDIVLKYEKPGGAAFPKTSLQPRPRKTALVDDSFKAKEMVDSVPDFSSLFPRKTPAEVQAILDTFLLSEQDAEGASSETTRYSNKATDVDKAFSDLL